MKPEPFKFVNPFPFDCSELEKTLLKLIEVGTQRENEFYDKIFKDHLPPCLYRAEKNGTHKHFAADYIERQGFVIQVWPDRIKLIKNGNVLGELVHFKLPPN